MNQLWPLELFTYLGSSFGNPFRRSMVFSYLPQCHPSLDLCIVQKPPEDIAARVLCFQSVQWLPGKCPRVIHKIMCFSSLAAMVNGWAQVAFPEACPLTHRKRNCGIGKAGACAALSAILTGGSSLGMPSDFLSLLPGRVGKFVT